MHVILEKIAEFAYQYGKDGEIPVPKELMDGEDEK